MKVICIDGDFSHNGVKPKHGSPKTGEVVTKECAHKSEGIVWYGIVEYPHDWFEAAAFIPLSSIDETEMERNYKTEKVCG